MMDETWPDSVIPIGDPWPVSMADFSKRELAEIVAALQAREATLRNAAPHMDGDDRVRIEGALAVAHDLLVFVVEMYDLRNGDPMPTVYIDRHGAPILLVPGQTPDVAMCASCRDGYHDLCSQVTPYNRCCCPEHFLMPDWPRRG